jgi:hypothetical protein
MSGERVATMDGQPVVNVMALRAERDREIARREAEIEAARTAEGDPRQNLCTRHAERIAAAAALDKATGAAAEASRLVAEAERHHRSLLERRRAHEDEAAAALAEQIAAGEAPTPTARSSDMADAIEAVASELRLGRAALDRLESRKADAKNAYDAAAHAEQTAAVALLVEVAVAKAEHIRETMTGVAGDRAELAALLTEVQRVKGSIPPVVNNAVYGQLDKADFSRRTLFAGVFEQLLDDPEAKIST